ncbi:hypothetical protein J7M00_08760 [bacterium]|nr:hypothetical protein [bacterium]
MAVRRLDGEAERFWGKPLLRKRLSPKPPSRKLLSLRKMPISQSTFFAEAKTFLDRVRRKPFSNLIEGLSEHSFRNPRL